MATGGRSSVIPRGVILAITVLISIALLAGFALMFGSAFVDTWQAKATPVYQEAWVYVATGLASFIGGVVAVAFGQRPPSDGGTAQASRTNAREGSPARPADPAPARPADPAPARPADPAPANTLHATAIQLGGWVIPYQTAFWQALVGSIYALIYVLWGLAAIVVWVTHAAVTPDIVKNLAVITLGLFIAIATAFLRPEG